MNIDKLWDTKIRLEKINRLRSAEGMELTQTKGAKFEERFKRITLYLENDVYSDLQAIRSQNIPMSTVVNKALKEFFQNNWPLSGESE